MRGIFCRGGRAARTGIPMFCGGVLAQELGVFLRFFAGDFFVAEGGRPERPPLHFAGGWRGSGEK